MKPATSKIKSSAFTLTEALTVIAVLGTAIAISFPAIAKRKALGAEAVCQQKQGALSQAQFQYMNQFKGQYAGINTSGAYYQGIYPSENPVVKIGLLLGNTAPNRPTSTWDWMSPIVGLSSNFSPNRARRSQQILSVWECPSVSGNNNALFGSAADRADFENAFVNGGFRKVSYLQPTPFHIYSSQNTNVPTAGIARLKQDTRRDVADAPASFSPRLFNVGAQPSMKVMHTDGTRFVVSGDFTDIDINLNPAINGSFADSPPANILSNAYSRSDQSASHGYGHKLSFRHASGKINAAFFDGSVRSISKEDAWGEAKYWYPGGSTFTGLNATPESLARYSPGSILP